MLIAMPEPVFSTSIRVIYGDTDAAGVVYNANYLRYFEVGRTEMMRSLVGSYKKIENLGFVMPVTECFTRFKASARYDDLIVVETAISDIKRYSLQFNYRVIRQDEDRPKRTLLVKGYTIHACVDRNGKLAPLPEDISNRLLTLCAAGDKTPQEAN